MTTRGWFVGPWPARPRRRGTRLDDEGRCPTGIAIALGAILVIGVTFVGAAMSPAPAPRLALLVVVIAAFAGLSGNGRAALAVAGLAWLIGNGFLLNRLGELTWHGYTDVGFVLALLGGVAIGIVVAHASAGPLAHRLPMPFDSQVDLADQAGVPNEPAAIDELPLQRPAPDRLIHASGGQRTG